MTDGPSSSSSEQSASKWTLKFFFLHRRARTAPTHTPLGLRRRRSQQQQQQLIQSSSGFCCCCCCCPLLWLAGGPRATIPHMRKRPRPRAHIHTQLSEACNYANFPPKWDHHRIGSMTFLGGGGRGEMLQGRTSSLLVLLLYRSPLKVYNLR